MRISASISGPTNRAAWSTKENYAQNICAYQDKVTRQNTMSRASFEAGVLLYFLLSRSLLSTIVCLRSSMDLEHWLWMLHDTIANVRNMHNLGVPFMLQWNTLDLPDAIIPYTAHVLERQGLLWENVKDQYPHLVHPNICINITNLWKLRLNRSPLLHTTVCFQLSEKGFTPEAFLRFKFFGENYPFLITLLQGGSFLTIFYNINSSPVHFTQ